MDGTLAMIASVAAEADDASDWGLFQAGFIGPLIDFGVVWVAVWLVAVVAARLLSALRFWTRRPTTRHRSMTAKVLGGLITALAAAAFVAVGAMTSAIAPLTPLAWVTVGLLGAAGVVVLAFGMATTPWLKITVTGTGGATNDAWATEVTVRMRELNADNPKGRIERPDGSDLNELVAIADRTDNWAVALVGGAMAMLLNLTPWRLEVTVFNADSGVARLRRNGRVVEDASLRLPAPPAHGEHPGELLTLAAAFAAVKVAHEYPDIVGFYNTENWLGLGLIGVARRTDDAELRERYIARARDADPRSILVEFEDVYERYAGVTDARRLRELIDRLEPMIEVAAEQTGRHLGLAGAQRKPWHGTTPPVDADPAREAAEAAAGARRRRRQFDEPPMLMLRLQSYYLMTMRNWLVSDDDVLNEATERRDRLRRATSVAGELVAALGELKQEEEKRRRRAQYADQRTSLERMEQRAALGLLLLSEECRRLGEAADDEVSRERIRLATEWKRAAMESDAIEVKYSVACYQSRCIVDEESGDGAEFDDLVRRLGGVCWVDEYRDLALADPELAPLVDPRRSERPRRVRMRDAVLLEMEDAWQIERFRRVRLQLERAGVRSPEDLVVPATQTRVVQRSDLDANEVEALADAARILRAALVTECDLIPDRFDGRDAERERWARRRAARALLDDGRHTVSTLLAEYAEVPEALIDDVARAMFWRPDDDEAAAVALYVDRMIEQLQGPRGLSLRAEDEPAA
ncbi:hypothetical protein [Agromyces sp. NPDC055658]